MKKTLVLVLALLLCAGMAEAGLVTISDPSVATEIGTRIRWGNTGFEGSIFDSSPFVQSPTLNPSGAPVWTLNAAYDFYVSYSAVTGVLGLGVDFNRDGDFLDSQESASRSFSEYLKMGFNYLSISGNEGGSTARSQITNLVINGTNLSDIAPNGSFLEIFYKDAAGSPFAQIQVEGQLTFLAAGTAQERPSWNFNLKGPAEVPEPATLLLFGIGMVGLAASRRRIK